MPEVNNIGKTVSDFSPFFRLPPLHFVGMENETLYGTEDGLAMNEDVGSWTAEKYRQLQLYAHQFTQGMKGKWKSLAYLDLYAGSGQSRVTGTNEILLGSPLIALSLDVKFDLCVFCERDPMKLAALEQRATRSFPRAKVQFISGDCDDPIFQLGTTIPRGALTLCFVDPYKLDIRFRTLQALAQNRNIDFLCLLASRMDAGRNPHNYTKEESTKFDELLESSDWRERWEQSKIGVAREPNLGDFICKEFSSKMETLGYLPTELHEMRPIKTDGGQVIYHLSLFTKNQTAKRFWQQASTYSQPQRNLFPLGE
jgi:three-Cys-motif partner protein